MSASTTVGGNLPDTGVFSLDYDQKNDLLIAGTGGRGIYAIADFARSLGGVQLTVTGDQLATTTDTLTFEIDTNNPTLLDATLNTEPEVQLPYLTVTKIVVDLRTGSNNLVLDFINGDPIPQGVNTFTYAATGATSLNNTITVNDAGTFSLSNSILTINSINVDSPPPATSVTWFSTPSRKWSAESLLRCIRLRTPFPAPIPSVEVRSGPATSRSTVRRATSPRAACRA
jgi:hypothetical protein